MRYHPLFMLARAVWRMASKPYVISGVMMLWGYLRAWLTGHERIDNPDLSRYLRRTQMRALTARLLPWRSTAQLEQ